MSPLSAFSTFPFVIQFLDTVQKILEFAWLQRLIFHLHITRHCILNSRTLEASMMNLDQVCPTCTLCLLIKPQLLHVIFSHCPSMCGPWKYPFPPSSNKTVSGLHPHPSGNSNTFFFCFCSDPSPLECPFTFRWGWGVGGLDIWYFLEPHHKFFVTDWNNVLTCQNHYFSIVIVWRLFPTFWWPVCLIKYIIVKGKVRYSNYHCSNWKGEHGIDLIISLPLTFYDNVCVNSVAGSSSFESVFKLSLSVISIYKN